MNSQSREDAARQLRAWAESRPRPSDQVEQMLIAVRSGLYDDQILQSRTSVPEATNFVGPGQRSQWHDQQHQQQRNQRNQHQQQPFANHAHPLPFNGFFSMPPMPAMPTIPPIIPNPPYPLPPTSVPAMFPTTALPNTSTPINQSSVTTIFPGGQSTQQASSYSGQQGTTTFQYNSSSTSMRLDPGAQFPSTMQPVFPAVAHSTPALVLQQQTLLQHQQQPTTRALPLHPQEPPKRPRDHNPAQQHTPALAATTAVPPETLLNPAMEEVVDKEPQDPRLAETFRRQLEADEATYFSPVPGRADRRVQR
jgi:hypothetical protein